VYYKINLKELCKISENDNFYFKPIQQKLSNIGVDQFNFVNLI